MLAWKTLPVVGQWNAGRFHHCAQGCAGDATLTGMQRILVMVGLLTVAAGLAWPWLSKLPWGRLPGDIHVVRDGFSFHFPIVTCLLVSLLITIVVWIVRR
jgi:hypothetical protein